MMTKYVYYNVYIKKWGGYFFGLHWPTRQHAILARDPNHLLQCLGTVKVRKS